MTNVILREKKHSEKLLNEWSFSFSVQINNSNQSMVLKRANKREKMLVFFLIEFLKPFITILLLIKRNYFTKNNILKLFLAK